MTFKLFLMTASFLIGVYLPESNRVAIKSALNPLLAKLGGRKK